MWTALAFAWVNVGETVFKNLKVITKGDALRVAEIAGIMGAKKTQDLIPLCH